MGVRIAQAQNTGSSGRSPKTLSGSASRSWVKVHLGQAGPEDQVLSEWLKTTPSRENESGDPEITGEPKPARARGSGPGAPSAPCHAFHPPQLRRGEDDIQP